MKKYSLTIFQILLFTAFAQAQTGVIGYGSAALQAAQNANPAMVGNNRFHIALPLISSAQMEWGSSFKLADWLRPSANGTKIDFNQFLPLVKPINGFGLNLNADLFNFGFRVQNDHYFSAGWQVNSASRLRFSDDLVKLLAEGNQQNPDLRLNEESVYTLGFTNLYLGYARSLLEGKLKMGVHAKYVAGLWQAQTDVFDVNIKTDLTSNPIYALSLSGNLSAKTAGLFNDSTPNFNLGKYGKGFGLDVGLTYQLTDAFEIGASVTNLGFINWQKNYAGELNTEGSSTVTFNGITRNLNAMSSNQRNEMDSLQTQLDGFFTPKLVKNNYSTSLPTTFYTSLTYQPNDKHAATFLLRGQFLGKNRAALAGLKYQFTPTRWLQLIGGANWLSGAGFGLGGGLVLSPSAFQLHILADNVLGFQLDKTRFASIQVGLNIVLKKKKEVEDILPAVFK